jgi:hypothetical protein
LANFFRLVFMKYYFTRKKDRCNTWLYTYIKSEYHELTFLLYDAIDNYIRYTKDQSLGNDHHMLADFHNFQTQPTILVDTASCPF